MWLIAVPLVFLLQKRKGAVAKPPRPNVLSA
jgi:hypothetical protein